LTLNRGVIKVTSAILLWSSLGIVVRQAGVGVHLIIFYSNLLSLFIIGPVVFLSGRHKHIPRGRGILKLLVLGPVTLLNTFLFLYALQNTTISNALMTHYIAPVIVALLAAIFLGERFSVRALSAIAISSIGLWIILGQGDIFFIGAGSGGMDGNTLGIISGLASGVAYAILIILVRVLAPGEDSLVLVFFQNLMMCVLLVPFIHEFPAHAALSILFVGLFHSTLAPLLYVSGLRTVHANTTAILGYMEPVSAILLGVFILGEVPGLAAVFGGILILVSGLIAIRGESGD
jgi:drug/metabolite transporter (DMT)-like permease